MTSVQIDLGIDALDGLAQATIFLDLDASAGLTLTLEGKGNTTIVDTTTKTNSSSIASSTAKSISTGTRKNSTASAKGISAASVKATSVTSSSSAKSSAKAASTSKVSTVVEALATTSTSKAAKATATAYSNAARAITVNGCIAVEGGLGVNAGANADFFGLFNKDTTVLLFNKKFDLFKVSHLSIGIEFPRIFIPSIVILEMLWLRYISKKENRTKSSSGTITLT